MCPDHHYLFQGHGHFEYMRKILSFMVYSMSLSNELFSFIAVNKISTQRFLRMPFSRKRFISYEPLYTDVDTIVTNDSRLSNRFGNLRNILEGS